MEDGMPMPAALGALQDADDSGKLVGMLVALAAVTASYHLHLASLGDEAAPAKIESPNASQDTVTSEMSRATAGARGLHGAALSPLDLRYGSHTGWVSRRLLCVFRLLALLYAAGAWALYFTGKRCCSAFAYAHVWNFAAFTLYFVLAVFVSLRGVRPGRSRQLRAWEKLQVFLLEALVPNCMFLLAMHAKFLRHEREESWFPSPTAPGINTLFAALNVVVVLGELGLNRVILCSHRFMYFSYFSLAHAIYVICHEKLSGEGFLLYEASGFLQLHTDSVPALLKLFMLQFAFHYLGCALVSLKQRFWTLPISHPIEGALSYVALDGG